MLSRRQGFSLVELMIVLGIISMLFVITSRLLQNSESDQEKAMRFAELISDVIRDARQDMIIGRGAASGITTMVPLTKKTLTFDTSGTGTFTLSYTPLNYTGAIEEKKWTEPFFSGEEKKPYRTYMIESIDVAKQTIDYTGGFSQSQE